MMSPRSWPAATPSPAAEAGLKTAGDVRSSSLSRSNGYRRREGGIGRQRLKRWRSGSNHERMRDRINEALRGGGDASQPGEDTPLGGYLAPCPRGCCFTNFSPLPEEAGAQRTI